MKKLIKEIEKLKGQGYGVNGISRDAAISDCIEIVKSYDPWIDVSELPPRDESEPDFSIDVMVTNGYGYRLGYYAFRTESWILHKYFRGDSPTHWAYLPEAKP